MSPIEEMRQAAQVAGAVAGSSAEGLLHWALGLVMTGLSIGARWFYNRTTSHEERLQRLELEQARQNERIGERHQENLRRFDAAEETIQNGFDRLEALIRNAPRR